MTGNKRQKTMRFDNNSIENSCSMFLLIRTFLDFIVPLHYHFVVSMMVNGVEDNSMAVNEAWPNVAKNTHSLTLDIHLQHITIFHAHPYDHRPLLNGVHMQKHSVAEMDMQYRSFPISNSLSLSLVSPMSCSSWFTSINESRKYHANTHTHAYIYHL